jgi:hypothetical protein
MSAVAIVSGVVEGLQLIDSLIQAASQVSTAVQSAQASGQPVDFTSILGTEAAAEQSVLDAIAAAKAAGK